VATNDYYSVCVAGEDDVEAQRRAALREEAEAAAADPKDRRESALVRSVMDELAVWPPSGADR